MAFNHSSSSNAEVKDILELHLYLPYVPSWPVLGRTLPLPLHAISWSTVFLGKPITARLFSILTAFFWSQNMKNALTSTWLHIEWVMRKVNEFCV